MRKIWSLVLLICLIVNGLGISFAQQLDGEDVVDEVGVSEEVPEEKKFLPSISVDNSIGVGKNLIFRAEISGLPEGGEIQEILWEFADGQFSSKEEVAHIFRNPGRYNVRLQVSWLPEGAVNLEINDFTKEVFVYERSVFLLTDLKQSPDRINSLKKSAEDNDTYLESIRAVVNLRLKNKYLEKIERSLEDIANSDTVIIWSDQVDLLNILNGFANRIDWLDKDIVVISDGNIGLLKNILRGVYSVIKPNRVIITRREAIDEFFTVEEERDVVEVIRSRGYDLDLVDASTLEEFNFFSIPSYWISYLQQQGVEDSVILAVLFLTVVVTLVTFLRLVIGLSSLGARTPIVFTYCFLVLGWPVGFLIIIILAIFTYLFRMLFFKSHILYTAKVGVLTSFLGLILLFVIGGVEYLGISSFDFASALMIVILAAMIDRVAGVEGERGLISILRVFAETIVIATIAYWFISWDTLQVLLISHPEVLVLFIVANVFMGRFTGLRLMEYFRFREILKYTEE